MFSTLPICVLLSETGATTGKCWCRGPIGAARATRERQKATPELPTMIMSLGGVTTAVVGCLLPSALTRHPQRLPGERRERTTVWL
jgi:hypothetical protein